MQQHNPDNRYPSPASIAAAAATLFQLHASDARFERFSSPACRELRKAMGPFARRMANKMFDGAASKSEYEMNKDVERERRARKAKIRALDKAHVEKTALRASRLKRCDTF